MKRIKRILKKLSPYLIIITYGLGMIFFTLKENYIYGADFDWISQYTVIPDYFRRIFYETKKLLPNLALQLGGGQNIFNYTYYGLLSPIFLISYLLPFVDMVTYTAIAHIFLYIITGILFYKFCINHYDKKISLFLALSILSLPSISYQFHQHIMFVNYIPFLILALMGIDKFITAQKSTLFILSTLLIILTNYYYSVCSVLVLLIYGIYKILEKNSTNLKETVKKILLLSKNIFISILISSFILLPTLYVVINTTRNSTSNISVKNLIIPNFNTLLYGSHNLGITFIFLISLLSILVKVKRKKSEMFLLIVTLIVTICPFFLYLLNGGLYIEGKVIIPFSLIYLILLGNFINNFFENRISLKKLLLLMILSILLISLTGYNNHYLYLIDFPILLLLLVISTKYNKKTIICTFTIISLASLSYRYNITAPYPSNDFYNQINSKEVTELINDINKKDSSFYRTLNTIEEENIVNKIYNSNYYQDTIYSSTYNSFYNNFYYKGFGNNIVFHSPFLSAGTNNQLFHTFMGVKYLVGTTAPIGYEKIESIGEYNLYQNDNAFPIIYASNKIINENIYQKLPFPYNIEAMLQSTVVKDDNQELFQFISKIKKYSIPNLKDTYEFSLSTFSNSKIYLEEPLDNKILFIQFDMNYNQDCSEGHQGIIINGITNLLSCTGNYYHNGNNKFRYVISSNEEINYLDVQISSGSYKISNIEVYVMDYSIYNDYKKLENINIDKANSTITGDIKVNAATYLTTSIPYDKGFKIYIDKKEVETEIVNTSFLGAKLPQGQHHIIIKYISPWYKEGVLCSIIGILLLVINFFLENKINLKVTNNKK